MKRMAFFALLIFVEETSLAAGNYDLPRSKQGIIQCWNQVHQRFGPDIQQVTQETNAAGTLIRFFISVPGGEAWMLTCHPASGKLVVTGSSPEKDTDAQRQSR